MITINENRGDLLRQWKQLDSSHSTNTAATEESFEEEIMPANYQQESLEVRHDAPEKLTKTQDDKASHSLLDESLHKVLSFGEHVWKGVKGESQQQELEQEEPELSLSNENLNQEFHDFRLAPSDVKSLVADDKAFRTLQRSLRKRQCATNLYLSQTIHCYVKHVKEVRERNEARIRSGRASLRRCPTD